MEKICSHCKLDFTVLNPLRIYCGPQCADKANGVRYRLLHGHSKRSKTHRIYKRRSVLIKSKIILEYKAAHPCPCGESDPVCLQFHHRNPIEKVFTIAHASHHSVGIDLLIAEMQKCDVICANCHFKHHAKEKNAGLAVPGRKPIPGSRRRFRLK